MIPVKMAASVRAGLLPTFIKYLLFLYHQQQYFRIYYHHVSGNADFSARVSVNAVTQLFIPGMSVI